LPLEQLTIFPDFQTTNYGLGGLCEKHIDPHGYIEGNEIVGEQKTLIQVQNQESILPNYDFFVFPIFVFKLGHFKAQTIFSHRTNI
jgi:hypothetical protein